VFSRSLTDHEPPETEQDPATLQPLAWHGGRFSRGYWVRLTGSAARRGNVAEAFSPASYLLRMTQVGQVFPPVVVFRIEWVVRAVIDQLRSFLQVKETDDGVGESAAVQAEPIDRKSGGKSSTQTMLRGVMSPVRGSTWGTERSSVMVCDSQGLQRYGSATIKDVCSPPCPSPRVRRRPRAGFGPRPGARGTACNKPSPTRSCSRGHGASRGTSSRST